MKMRVLINDPSGRYQIGDVGIVLENDFEKYDYKLFFGLEESCNLFSMKIVRPLIWYFYKDEVELCS